ncbi:PaaI family thioesterase [Parahaliea maris]|uniref:PaaI family thioesterase n=2 Tax=Parahaliea maris TaxID=2716870 RepID=A0A5C9A5A5_9GAMM|nr:PaaI family thioesterase [Parahaliea maris]
MPTGFGYTDTLQPFYRHVTAEEVAFGLHVCSQHANSMGICHGGVLMTMADIAAASGVNHARGELGGSPTINLSLDFISAGKLGDWLEARISEVTVKRRFGFCNGLISNERGIVARFNGTFYLPDHEGMWKGEKRLGALSPAAD